MKRALIILGACLLVGALVTAPGTSAQTAQVAKKKKKKTYCQKTGAAVKAKLKAKSNGFYVYLEKGGYSVMICQDKPKFYGSFSLDAKGDKVSQLHVVKKKCAIYAERGSTHNPKTYAFNFSDFTSGNGQASVYEVGYQQGPSSLLGLGLSQNCAAVYGVRVNGVGQIIAKGTSAFGYTGALQAPVGSGITDKELAGVKIAGTGSTATVSWTEGGQAKTYVYQQPPPAY